MVAVAEEAQRRFRAKIETALGSVPAADPLAGFQAFRLALSALDHGAIPRMSRSSPPGAISSMALAHGGA
ncbi:hypothetical protein [Bradyrhizobium sp. CCBAU 51765]|uniref:hypothetical protein n=1 Tax=Bradyrhizobium sp. CCBAU 51765 TaxID=1325102 RepID=UPI00188744EA|nr:hypothetical protein [Bradyrhizobium sp. CCBAU 51765]